MKRKFKSEDDVASPFNWSEDFGGGKRRATAEGFMGSDFGMVRVEQPRRKSVDVMQDIDVDKTVRGRLHWLGVMKDWKWEGEFATSFFVNAKANISKFSLGEISLQAFLLCSAASISWFMNIAPFSVASAFKLLELSRRLLSTLRQEARSSLI